MKLYIKKELSVSSIIYLGQFLVGYGMGWTGPMIPRLQEPGQTTLPSAMTDVQASWVGGALFIGALIGPYISGHISNYRGRKPCLLLGGALIAFAFLILALSRNLAMVFAGIILTGLGSSILFVTNLVYLGEIAATNIRGLILSGTGIFMTFGSLVVFIVGTFAPNSATSYIGFALTVFYIGGLYFEPETPMFYLLQGREEEARKSLAALGRNDDISTYFTKLDDSNGQWKDLFTIKSNRRALFITFMLNLLQNMSGIAVMVYYITPIFELAGWTLLPSVATMLIGVIQVVSSSITEVFVEWIGRRALLLISTGACCLSLVVMGTYFYIDYIDRSDGINVLPMLTLIIFFLFYDLGFGIIPSTLVGEMFPSNIRSTGSAVAVSSGWILGFVISVAYTHMLTGMGGHFTLWIFAAACGLAFLFTLFIVPETKGKTFVEIQEMLSK